MGMGWYGLQPATVQQVYWESKLKWTLTCIWKIWFKDKSNDIKDDFVRAQQINHHSPIAKKNHSSSKVSHWPSAASAGEFSLDGWKRGTAPEQYQVDPLESRPCYWCHCYINISYYLHVPSNASGDVRYGCDQRSCAYITKLTSAFASFAVQVT